MVELQASRHEFKSKEIYTTQVDRKQRIDISTARIQTRINKEPLQ